MQISKEKTKQLQRLIFWSPFYYVTIGIEKLLEPFFELRFPRNHHELTHNPQKLFDLLITKNKSLAKDLFLSQSDCKFLDIKPITKLTNEPDKNRTAGSYKITYKMGDKILHFDFFIKFQCGRGLPLWLQAIRAAVEPNIAREINFYQKLSGKVGLKSPQPYYADSIHQFNRVCLVLEHIEGYNPLDWQGCSIQGARSILHEVAKMNAKFLGSTATNENTAWIPANKGLDFIGFIDDFIKNEPIWYRELWLALVSYFDERPVTLCHGDCRPGNMFLMNNEKVTSQISKKSELEISDWSDNNIFPEVIFTDWEAVNVAPLLWDFTYCTTLGLRIVDRQTYRDRLLDEFLLELKVNLVPLELSNQNQCRTEVELLSLVLYYYASTVKQRGFWNQQGNTDKDDEAWSKRLISAIHDVNTQKLASILQISEKDLFQLQSIAPGGLKML